MAISNQQIIAGLYVAFYNRAPDKTGLAYWDARAGSENSQAIFQEIAAGFAEHPMFTTLYDGMNNQHLRF